jgi:hypothetical protein
MIDRIAETTKTIARRLRLVVRVLSGPEPVVLERAAAVHALERSARLDAALKAADDLAEHVDGYIAGDAPLGALVRGVNAFRADRRTFGFQRELHRDGDNVISIGNRRQP